MGAVERVRELVEPLVEQESVELYDIEHEAGILRIMLDRPGGIDVDIIGDLSQAISDALDANDPIPESRYLLEVTSPGIERRLRTPKHFATYVGEEISVKVRREVEGDRRFEGVLKSAGDDGVEVSVSTKKDGDVTRALAYDDIDTARLIFRWEDEKGSKVAKKQSKSQLNNDKKKASAQ